MTPTGITIITYKNVANCHSDDFYDEVIYKEGNYAGY